MESEPTAMEVLESTQLIRVTEGKHKYFNTRFQRINAKMYDYNCDVQLKVEKQTFRAHRHVLSASSDYFAAMFSHDMKEKLQDDVELLEISSAGFAQMMEYFYHGFVMLNPDNIEDVIEASQFFQVNWLKHVCCHFLVNYLSIENYHVVLQLADTYTLGDLRQDIFCYIGQEFMALSQKPMFKMLAFELFLQLLSEDFYIEAPEGYILLTILRWVKHDPEDREKYLLQLLNEVRFHLMKLEELERIPQYVLDMPGIKPLVDDAFDYRENVYSQCLSNADSEMPRGGKKIIAMLASDDSQIELQLKIIGTHGFFRQPLKTEFMKTKFEFASIATFNNFLFICGGYEKGAMLSTNLTYRYDPRDLTWIDVAPMNERRVSFSLIQAQDYMYAIAGISRNLDENDLPFELILNTVERYNPLVNEWSTLASLPHGCFDTGAGVSGDNIYLTGGITDNPDDSIPVNYNFRYSMTQDNWLQLSPMLTARKSHSMTAHMNKLFVFGGTTTDENFTSTDCTKNECYDTSTDQWSYITPTPESFGFLYKSVIHHENDLYILGGKHILRYLHKVNLESLVFDEHEEAEVCGHYYQKMALLTIPFPYHIKI
ncbi:unnamed protein product [Owenia fusiformis]|uniref:BTB domain-containing protein n=1 Tax=Owenia fusiformis TaxID=6347 RepID=A0A8S4NSJ6_OWEFU|nr:unnamed protein product [Owenia fusiformis]